MAMKREDCAGGRVVSPVGSRRDEVGQREEEVQRDRPFEVTRHSRYGLRGVRVGDPFNPGPQSTRIDSNEEAILPDRSSPWCHGDSAECVPIPGKSTVADTDLESGCGFVSVVSQRRSRRGGRHRATSTTVFPFQANRFAVFDAEIGARNDHRQAHEESESDWFEAPGGSTSEGEGSCSCHPAQQRRQLILPTAMRRDSSVFG